MTNSKTDAKASTAILLETEAQVQDSRNRFGDKNGVKLIALSPFAAYELEKQDMPFSILEDYYKPEEVYKLGAENYSRVERMCETIDRAIQSACKQAYELDFKPALYSIFTLKNVYDAATLRLFQLSQLIRTEKPDALLVYAMEKFPPLGESVRPLLFDNRESVYARLMELPGWNVAVQVLPRIPEKFAELNEPVSYKIIEKLRKHPLLYELAASVRKKGFSEVLYGLANASRANEVDVLLFGGGYNWDYCKKELRKSNIRVIRAPDYSRREPREEPDANELLGVWTNLVRDEKFREFFIYGGIDFFPVLESRLRLLVEKTTPTMLGIYKETKELLRKKGTRAVVSSSLFGGYAHAISKAARDSGMPVITWQHGNYGYVEQPMVVYQDLMGSNVHLVFGEGVAKRYSAQAKRFGTQLVSVGSAALEALQKKHSQAPKGGTIQRKNVLYATTNYYQNHLYISFSPPLLDNLVWRTQKYIISILGKHRDLSVMVKLHPSYEYREPPMRKYADDMGFKNCRFLRHDYSFPELLTNADIVIIDLPSTILLQALTTKKPIFVYTGHLDIDEDALKLLKKRAYCYKNLKEFAKALEKFLAGDDVGATVDLNSTEFLKLYGTHEGDSEEKAAGIVKITIETWEKMRRAK